MKEVARELVVDKTPAFCKAMLRICMSHQTNFGTRGRGRGGRLYSLLLSGESCNREVVVLTTSLFCANLAICSCKKSLLFMDAKI